MESGYKEVPKCVDFKKQLFYKSCFWCFQHFLLMMENM